LLLFPGCPPQRADAIARHAGTRGSGRVGRTAAGRALHEEAVTLAVVASVRHCDTSYDELLMSGVPRAEARDPVWDDVDLILEKGRKPSQALTVSPPPPGAPRNPPPRGGRRGGPPPPPPPRPSPA